MVSQFQKQLPSAMVNSTVAELGELTCDLCECIHGLVGRSGHYIGQCG